MTDEELLKTAKDALASPAPAKGYRSTEFWLTLAAGAAGTFLASGIVPDTHWSVKLAGIIATTLSVLGYQMQRTKLKL